MTTTPTKETKRSWTLIVFGIKGRERKKKTHVQELGHHPTDSTAGDVMEDAMRALQQYNPIEHARLVGTIVTIEHRDDGVTWETFDRYSTTKIVQTIYPPPATT